MIISHDMHVSVGSMLAAWHERGSQHGSVCAQQQQLWKRAFVLAKDFILCVVSRTRSLQTTHTADITARNTEAFRRGLDWFRSCSEDNWTDYVLAAFSLAVVAVSLADVFHTIDPHPFFGWCPRCIGEACSMHVQTNNYRCLSSLRLGTMSDAIRTACMDTLDVIVCPCTSASSKTSNIYHIYNFTSDADVRVADFVLQQIWQTCIVADFYLPYMRRLLLNIPDDLLSDVDSDSSNDDSDIRPDTCEARRRDKPIGVNITHTGKSATVSTSYDGTPCAVVVPSAGAPTQPGTHINGSSSVQLQQLEHSRGVAETGLGPMEGGCDWQPNLDGEDPAIETTDHVEDTMIPFMSSRLINSLRGLQESGSGVDAPPPKDTTIPDTHALPDHTSAARAVGNPSDDDSTIIIVRKPRKGA